MLLSGGCKKAELDLEESKNVSGDGFDEHKVDLRRDYFSDSLLRKANQSIVKYLEGERGPPCTRSGNKLELRP